jgi:FKBP-type peptidyl-prolyl cis-trans isomerase
MRLVGLIALVALGGACSKLTSPPGPEPIASDTPVTMASAPTVPSGHPAPTNARPSLTALAQANGSASAQGPQAEVKIEDAAPGSGPAVKMGDTVVVHYTGTLLDGTKFDSSKDRGQPFTTRIPGQVIQGWNRGIPGMKVGGKRKLTIPPSLGYGPQGQGKIPPNSTLVFDIELLEIKPSAPRQMPPRAP